MVRETWVPSQVASYQRLLKWYLIPPCLTLSNIRWVSRVKWNNPGKGVVPSPTPQCSSYRKESLRVALDYSQLYLSLINRNGYTGKTNIISSEERGMWPSSFPSVITNNLGWDMQFLLSWFWIDCMAVGADWYSIKGNDTLRKWLINKRYKEIETR